MFKLAHALKHYREAGSLNEKVNLFGFINNHAFLTKSGDVERYLSSRIELNGHLRRIQEV